MMMGMAFAEEIGIRICQNIFQCFFSSNGGGGGQRQKQEAYSRSLEVGGSD